MREAAEAITSKARFQPVGKAVGKKSLARKIVA
jgi:hypothetical protein